MTEPVVDVQERNAMTALAIAVLIGAWMRIAVAVAGGIVELVDAGDQDFPSTTYRAGDVLITFGSAGDGVGVLLGLAALGLAWLAVRSGARADRLWAVTQRLLGLTAVSAFVQVAGYFLLFGFGPEHTVWWRLILSEGQVLAFAVVALGGLTAANRLAPIAAGRRVARDDAGEPLVFAVDRRSGDVRAFFSLDEAERKVHVYSVEDDEYTFFTDEGSVVQASVEHDRVVLRTTAVDQREVLLGRLHAFAARREIAVHPDDADDPAAYVRPISEWQWLQLWPGWLRWVARLFRAR